MVGNLEGTVGFDEKTVAFKKATDWLKLDKGVDYGKVSSLLGLRRTQMDMVRAFRRKVTNQEIRSLMEAYPETARFFKNTDTTLEHESPPATQALNEPMSTNFYGKQPPRPEPWEELVETQRKLIAMLEKELAEVKERLKVVEVERNALVEIVTQKK